MSEQWLPIAGYEGFYEVSIGGRVRTPGRQGIYAGRWGPMRMVFPAREMALSTSTGGYKYVALKRPNEKSVKHLVHRLVMAAFVGAHTPDRPQVNHKDGRKDNNTLDNLEYCSSSENLQHLTKVLKRKIGGAGGYSKLTEAQAMAVLSDGRKLKEIAADYGVTMAAISLLKLGRNWPHLHAKRKALEEKA